MQDIRQHGFDVLLMLEASIALNDLSDKEDAQVEVPAGLTADQPFSQNDLSFLRSLRISVDGENVTGEKQDEAEPCAQLGNPEHVEVLCKGTTLAVPQMVQ